MWWCALYLSQSTNACFRISIYCERLPTCRIGYQAHWRSCLAHRHFFTRVSSIIRSVLHNTKQVLPLSCLRSNTRSNVFDPVIYFVVWRASTSESVMRQNYTTFTLHQTAFFVSRKTFEMSFLPELMRSKRREVSLIDSSLWSIQRPWKVYITLDNAKGSLLSVLYPHEG